MILFPFNVHNVCIVQKPCDSLGVKSFEEIMRDKQRKRVAVTTAGSREIETPATSETEQITTVRKGSADVRRASKTKQAPPRKYKFTPIVFDLDSKGSGPANSGTNAQLSKRKTLEIHADADNNTVLGRRRVSISKAAAETAVTVTDISVAVQSSVPSISDLTTEAVPAVTESPADSCERKISPVVKRQLSSTPLSDGSKKRRTSVDSR